MHPDPIFYIFGKGVYLYGICMALGLIACFAFLVVTMKLKKFNEASSDTILLIGVFGTGFGILCAALFQATYNYIDNPAAGFKLNSMTFLGGLIGGVASFLGVYFLYMYVVRPRVKVKFLTAPMNATLTDALPFIPIAITIAHAFGRLGCFFGGCCYGRVADWGLPCADAPGFYGVNVIPTQLFEMSFLILLGVVMAVLYFKFKFNYNFAVYMIAYAIWRFIIEYFRADYRGLEGLSLTPSQIWSIVMVILGVGYIFLQYYVLKKHMKHPELDGVEEEKPSEQPETSEN